MGTARVIEYRDVSVLNNVFMSMPKSLPLRVQIVDLSDESAATADPIGSDCGLVLIATDAAAFWAGGSSPTATENDCPIAAERPFAYVPTSSHKIAFIGAEPEAAGIPLWLLLLLGA